MDVHLDEYRIMRGEISLYQQQQNQAISFCVIVLVGFLALHSKDITVFDNSSSTMLLLLPIFVLIFGFLYVDRTMRIGRIGRYINSVLKVRIMELLDGHDVLLWETYKRVISDEYSGGEKKIVWFLERIRIVIFLLIFIMPLFLYWAIKHQHGLYLDIQNFTVLEIMLLFINAFMLLAFIGVSWQFEETKGADSDRSLVKKVLAKSRQQHGDD